MAKTGLTAQERRKYETIYWDQGKAVIGIDEAGRGPLCGPLVVAGVSFPTGYFNEVINDSKVLSATVRQELFREIIKKADYFKIIIVSPQEIDHDNIYRATQKAMGTIAESFKGIALTDCMPLPNIEHLSLVKGDQKSFSIAAASILAKVVRDHIMTAYDLLYPGYGFAKHKGYPTKEHLENLNRLGALPIYRFSYKPLKTLDTPTLFDW